VPVATGARIGESGCKGCLWVRGRLGKLTRLTAEAESSPMACLSSPKPRRKEEDGADRRDLPVSDRVRRRACARSARVGRAGAGRPAGRFPGLSLRRSVFLFLFMQFLLYV